MRKVIFLIIILFGINITYGRDAISSTSATNAGFSGTKEKMISVTKKILDQEEIHYKLDQGTKFECNKAGTLFNIIIMDIDSKPALIVWSNNSFPVNEIRPDYDENMVLLLANTFNKESALTQTVVGTTIAGDLAALMPGFEYDSIYSYEIQIQSFIFVANPEFLNSVLKIYMDAVIDATATFASIMRGK